MQIINWLPLFSTIVTFVFAFFVLRRWWSRRPANHLLLWGLGLVLYGLGTFSEFYSAQAWSPTIFRLWYLCGAILTAAWLGQGTVYLLVRRPYVAHVLMAILLLGSLFAVLMLWSTPLPGAGTFSTGVSLSDQYKGILPEGARVRLLTPFFNIYGVITLVGGAIYSAFLFWRKRILPNRVLGNVFIALGALSPAIGGTLARLGTTGLLYGSELIGAILMFIGFQLAVTKNTEHRVVPLDRRVEAVIRDP
ncbi:MAG: hypothetical protein ACE5LU_00070 [Anaerolineae bacterium]